jgi:acyl carrier protein
MEGTNSINKRIREFVLRHFPLARKKSITDDVALLDEGIIDSLGVLDLINFIEEEFKISISDEDLVPENFQSIQSIVIFIEQKQERFNRV